MTEVVLISGIKVYTDLPVEEVRHYLQNGVGTKTFEGYLEVEKTTKIMVSAHSVQYVKI